MKPDRIFPLKLLITTVFCLLIYSGPVMAQIATTSLDPTLRAEVAAPTALRYASTVAASATAGTWEEIYNNIASDVIYGEAAYLLASHIVGPFYTEAFNAVDRKATSNDKDYEYNYQLTKNQVNFAFLLGDWFCIGGNYFAATEKESDQTPISNVASKDEQIGIGLSATMAFGELLYLGGGLEMVSEESDVKVKNDWTNLMYGIALRDGHNEDSEYRLEYARIVSKESVKPASDDGTLFKNTHYAVDNTRITAEYLIEAIRLLIRYENQHIKTNIASDQNLIQDRNSFGIIWLPEVSWIVGFTVVSGKDKAVFADSSDNYNKSTPRYYRANVGYSF